MAYDNSNVKPPIIDLLYPSEEQRRACLKRKAQIEGNEKKRILHDSQHLVDDTMLAYVNGLEAYSLS